jgi:hypothetical protein
MNAFWASENCDAFIAFRSSQPGENTAENSNSERPSFRGADHRLQFLAADQGDPVLEDRLLAAIDADDAAREAAFWGWPAGARVCRIADLDGQEVASVARFS